MAAPSSLPSLLNSLTQSLSSAVEAAPKLAGIEPPSNGLSLLDIKNELLLSYLQNLVFLILVKLRQSRKGGQDSAHELETRDSVVKKLVELRLYLEKGVRPLEDKLRYQIEKVLRAADDIERNAQAAETAKVSKISKHRKPATVNSGSAGSDGVEFSEDDSEEAEEDAGESKLSDLQYRPNLSAFVRPAATTGMSKQKDVNGVYKPPKIAPTVMPTTERRERVERRPIKSATLDEFIADEFSGAPMAEPSIGTTIVAGGRDTKTAAERAAEAERQDYEERNFVRLPKESKTERAKKAKLTANSRRMNFGGEEWRELGEGVDRIDRLTKGRNAATGTKALLEKSRKRGLETTDRPRGTGNSNDVQMGERYQKRLKVLAKQDGERKRNK